MSDTELDYGIIRYEDRNRETETFILWFNERQLKGSPYRLDTTYDRFFELRDLFWDDFKKDQECLRLKQVKSAERLAEAVGVEMGVYSEAMGA